MKLATFTAPGLEEPRAGVFRDDVVNALEADQRVVDVLAGQRPRFAGCLGHSTGWRCSPRSPTRATIYAIGSNYAKHVEETGGQRPRPRSCSSRCAGSVAAPGGPIACPEVVRWLDYEGELTIVMGAGGQIAGYSHRRRRDRQGPPGARAAVDPRQGR